MPELPDLEVIREYLRPRLVGVPIRAVDVRRPIVLRNLVGGDPASHLLGRWFVDTMRRGKYLLLPLDSGTTLVVNPMLAGRLRYGNPIARGRSRDVLVLGFVDGKELRYHDAKDMGRLYLTDDLSEVPMFDSQGPEATDAALTLDVFQQRLAGHRGEIKGVLTNQSFIAGVGNAYADEILWRAGIYPFRRRSTLSAEETRRLYTALRNVLAEAIDVLRARTGDAIDVELRDFLAVHGKAGQPCPHCGSAISQVTRQLQATHFCRTCQPGIMVGDRSLATGPPPAANP